MKPWIRKIGKDGKPPSWRPADDARAPYRSGHVEAKTRAKKAAKCSISLRRMGLSTSLILLVGLRRPLAFRLPVPLRVQSLGYGSVQRSAIWQSATLQTIPSGILSYHRRMTDLRLYGSWTGACGPSWSCRVSHPKDVSFLVLFGALGPVEPGDRLWSWMGRSNIINIDRWTLPG